MGKRISARNLPRGHIFGAFFEGEKVRARVVRVLVALEHKSTFWSNHLAGTERQAIEIILRDGTLFYVDNVDGSTVAKLTKGRGNVIQGIRLLPIVKLIPDDTIRVSYRG